MTFSGISTQLSRDVEQIEHSLRQWFPSQAFVKAAKIQHYPILPEEQALVANAVSSRQHEFATGRWLSRQGLQSFGLPDQPIKMGRLRNPLWPESVTGTISHDGELCAVVLMQKHQHCEAGIGIDLVSLPQRVGRMDELAPMFLANTDELSAMAAFNLAVDPALLLFSVKESVVKAMSFQLDDFIDMRAIEIYHADKLRFRISGNAVSTDIVAATTGNYLITAIKVR
ncbi:4'-phosphopantetheinyl transferase superfamily protein [Methylobacter sp. Wu8]|uniref:4'-phosphopantetheinyl transferase family protein n=1 Tax=Methylobacter sp. Wu8 TaxID=3118457 RepID=UPI002F2EA692